jgi:hypothetical protein
MALQFFWKNFYIQCHMLYSLHMIEEETRSTLSTFSKFKNNGLLDVLSMISNPQLKMANDPKPFMSLSQRILCKIYILINNLHICKICIIYHDI